MITIKNVFLSKSSVTKLSSQYSAKIVPAIESNQRRVSVGKLKED